MSLHEDNSNFLVVVQLFFAFVAVLTLGEGYISHLFSLSTSSSIVYGRVSNINESRKVEESSLDENTAMTNLIIELSRSLFTFMSL